MAKYGDMATVGFYEMASKTVLLFRAILVNANKVLVPQWHICMKSIRPHEKYYGQMFSLLLYLSLPVFAGLIAFAPYVAHLWIGVHEARLSGMIVILAIGWFVNVMAGPAYFMNMGTGALSWNTLSHVIIGLANVVLGIFAGVVFGGKFVVWAWTLSLIIGSIVIPISYQWIHGVSHVMMLRQNVVLLLSCSIGASTSIIVYEKYREHYPVIWIAIPALALYFLIVMFAAWFHPTRVYFSGLVSSLFRKMLEKSK